MPFTPRCRTISTRAIYTDILAAGKHLFGEKPFGIDVAANAAIVAKATRHPELVVRCSSQYPFFPASQRLVRYAREGAFGTILEVEAGFLHSSDLDPTKPKNWKRDIADQRGLRLHGRSRNACAAPAPTPRLGALQRARDPLQRDSRASRPRGCDAANGHLG